MLSGANVVHFIDAKIRRRLIISFLRIVLGDPLGIEVKRSILLNLRRL